MLIYNTSQVLTLAGGVQRGAELGQLGIISRGAVLIQGETITAVGATDELLRAYPAEERLDARGCAVLPGFVDPHTHLAWAGERAAEFEMRLQGKTYLEILAAGGGILSTVRATRAASLADLKGQTLARAASLFRHGTTTAEVKTGYGLELDTELRQLQAIVDLDEAGPLEMVPTFMGAHAVPAEFQNDPDGYVAQICSQMLPAAAAWWRWRCPGRPMPFVDVFCERGAFSLAQSRAVLEAARQLGFGLKIHADEFENLGGAGLAVELGAASADHLVKTSAEEIRALGASSTVAVALPCTPFGLADPHYTPAQAVLDAGGALALASDINPGGAWCESMQFVLALACRYLRLTPAQAVAASTINAAAAVGRAEKIGSLEPGKQADLLILSVDDYRHLAYRYGANLVRTVVKKGRAYPV